MSPSPHEKIANEFDRGHAIAANHQDASTVLGCKSLIASPLQIPRTGEVHVWLATLDLPTHVRCAFEAWLSEDERSKAASFRSAEGRHRYIAARGLLRKLLSCYAGIEPRQLRLVIAAGGKPRIEEGAEGEDLYFNLAHSNSVAVYAVTCGQRIGIDIERVQADFNWQDIAKQFFSSNEATMLLSLPSSLQSEAFFRCWTRKEAYLKARGNGLTLALNTFEVIAGQGQQSGFVRNQLDLPGAPVWYVRDLELCEGYVGAVVTEGVCLELRGFDLAWI
jgi:4'-phosphopantetheinyl transferase